jgi:bifunctional DNA-binding transcriptional regulator/antitoxin component of YhaV-PrlF toxin-antitoxin module
MKTLITRLTDRGQTSVPASVRRKMRLAMGARLLWEPISDHECRILVQDAQDPDGPIAMLGFARTFRKARSTAEWMRELREGEQ